jgi:hypothetical protein
VSGIRSDLGWKPTYDKHATKEDALKDVSRRRKHASSRTHFQIKRYDDYWTVEYKEATT